jgi:hypothetical protein
MADLDLLDQVDGYAIPLDPMDLLQCDSCQ